MNCPLIELVFDNAVQPAQVDARKGIVISGIDSASPKNFPASKSFPPPMAIRESQLFLRIIILILSRSS